MILEIDFANKKKKPPAPAASVTPIPSRLMNAQGSKAQKSKKDEHLTISI